MKKQTWIELRNVNVSPESLSWNSFWKRGAFWKTNWAARLSQISFCTWTKLLCTARRQVKQPQTSLRMNLFIHRLLPTFPHLKSCIIKKDTFCSTVLTELKESKQSGRIKTRSFLFVRIEFTFIQRQKTKSLNNMHLCLMTLIKTQRFIF